MPPRGDWPFALVRESAFFTSAALTAYRPRTAFEISALVEVMVRFMALTAARCTILGHDFINTSACCTFSSFSVTRIIGHSPPA
nr:MAG TPA: hypothetical protein [Caudoviricetes sp.]